VDNLKLTIVDKGITIACESQKQKIQTNNCIRVFGSKVLTMADVAKAMQVSQKTVQRWISSKKLRAARIGHKTYRILEKDLERFLEDHMQ
jgi:excisionase family DNA binding protein